MAAIDVDLRSWLLADAAIAAATANQVHKSHAPESASGTYVIYLRRGLDHERTTDQQPGAAAFREYFDVEIYGDTVAAVETVAGLLRAKDCTVGTFGERTVQAVFVEDHSDDYVPKGNDADEIIAFAALQLEIVP